MRIIHLFIFVVLSLYSANTLAKDIRIGVLAISGKKAAVEAWTPTIDYLNSAAMTAQSNPHFVLVAIEPGNMQRLESMVKNKDIDFFIVSPALFADLENLYGASAILTLVDKSQQAVFGSVIFVRNDNTAIKNLQDATTKSIAAVASKGFAGWLVSHNLFRQNGIDLTSQSKGVHFLGTQPKVVEAVFNNKLDVGIVRTGIIEGLIAKGEIETDSLRILNPQTVPGFPYLLSTDLYPEWALAKTSHVSRSLAKKVATALLSLPPGDDIALTAGYWEWMPSQNYQSVHELMKTLRVGSYAQYGNVSLVDYIKQNRLITALSLFLFLTLCVFLVLLRQSNRNLRNEQKAKNNALENLQIMATHDDLTGLPNRTLMLELLEMCIASVDRTKGLLAVMFIDLDGFKAVNDTLGHDMGDKVLIDVAKTLKGNTRKNDICSRIGGDEFIIVAYNFHNETEVGRIADKLIHEITCTNTLREKPVQISASIGIFMTATAAETNVDALINGADELMYQAKAAGKGQYVINALTNESA